MCVFQRVGETTTNRLSSQTPILLGYCKTTKRECLYKHTHIHKEQRDSFWAQKATLLLDHRDLVDLLQLSQPCSNKPIILNKAQLISPTETLTNTSDKWSALLFHLFVVQILFFYSTVSNPEFTRMKLQLFSFCCIVLHHTDPFFISL